MSNLNLISQFLVANHSSPTVGYTVSDIRSALPLIPERTIYRILRDNPQFKQTVNSIHPKKWYCDLGKQVIEVKSDPLGSLVIRPEFKVGPLDSISFVTGLANNLDQGNLANLVRSLVKAAVNAQQFQSNEAKLDPEQWEATKQSLDVLERFAAILYQRIQQLKDHEHYNSPEWWTIFREQ